MEQAFVRAIESVPVRSLDECRVPGKRSALRIVSDDCPSCAEFAQRRRGGFEASLGAGVVVIELSVDHPRTRALVVAAGVERIPAYVLLDDPIKITYPWP